jgi:hypothetical protein
MATKAKRKTSTAKSKNRKVMKSKAAKKAKKQNARKKGKQPKPKTRKKAAKKTRAPRSGETILRPAAESFHPPHKCVRTPNGCLKFFPDRDGAYLLPPGGQAVDCAECQYWF